MNKISTIVLAALAFLGTFATAQTSAKAPVITIIHTNDTHSQIDPGKDRSGELKGGATKRAAMLEYFRKNEDPQLLYFDCGDMVQGSPYFNIFKGELEVLCMNQQQLVASTLGNHEFDNGLEALDKILSKADFPLVCCNYHCENTPIASRIVPHMILQNHDVKIGVTGASVSPEGLIFAKYWEGITFEDPITAVNREAAILRQEGCDLVIVLSHLGYQATPTPGHTAVYDSDLAKASCDIDLILGGHTHTNIERGAYIENQQGKQVLITQTGGKMAPMGYVQVTMKHGSDYPGCHYSVDSIVCRKLHEADYDLTGLGQQMEECIAPYREQLSAQMNERLCFAPSTLTRGRTQSTLGNFTADAYRLVGEKLTGKKIDVSIMNNGGLRSDLAAGDVSIGTMYSIFPFENSIVVLDLKGSDLEQLIQSNAGRKLDCWSGTQITLEMDGDRCIASKILVNGQVLDPERLYSVCTIDYLAEGNSGMSALTRAMNTTYTGILIRDAMIDYVRELEVQGKQVTAELDDRVIDLTKGTKEEPRN